MKSKALRAVGLAFLLVLVLSATSLAASEEAPRRKFKHETITVTAQKQEEDIQDVPVGMSVFNETDLEDKSIENAFDMADHIPNLMLYQQSSGFVVPSMRGISSNPEAVSVPIGLYVDGVPILNPNGFEEEFVDIDRVEVLRGPQSTLYGTGAEVGVINIYTRQPDNTWYGKIGAKAGKMLSGKGKNNGLTQNIFTTLMGPIAKDKLYFGLTGKFDHQDGFMKNTYEDSTVDDRRDWFAKGQLRWTPSSDLDISLIAWHQNKHDDNNRMNMSQDGTDAYNQYLPMFGITLPDPQYREVRSNYEDPEHSWTNDSAALKINYDINNNFTLSSVSSYWRHLRTDNGDFDFNEVRLLASESDFKFQKISQELRLNYNGDRVKGVVGVYCGNDRNSMDTETQSIIPSLANTMDRKSDGSTYAAFTNLTYAFAEKWSLNAGIRYGYETKKVTNNETGESFSDGWDDISPRVALQYQIVPDAMVYASVSRGFRSGGFSMGASKFGDSYGPESLWSYELGTKTMFLDNRLLLNADVYYMQISDMQVKESPTPYRTVYSNAAEATGTGAEIEMTFYATDSLSFNGGFGYSRVEFDSFSDAKGDYAGNLNPYSPEYTFNLGAQYRHASGLYARADLVGYGKMYLDKANKYSRGSYELVNAKIGYEMDQLDIYLYGRNIFDTKYDSYGEYSGAYTVYSQPGEVGIEAVYRF